MPCEGGAGPVQTGAAEGALLGLPGEGESTLIGYGWRRKIEVPYLQRLSAVLPGDSSVSIVPFDLYAVPHSVSPLDHMVTRRAVGSRGP